MSACQHTSLLRENGAKTPILILPQWVVDVLDENSIPLTADIGNIIPNILSPGELIFYNMFMEITGYSPAANDLVKTVWGATDVYMPRRMDDHKTAGLVYAAVSADYGKVADQYANNTKAIAWHYGVRGPKDKGLRYGCPVNFNAFERNNLCVITVEGVAVQQDPKLGLGKVITALDKYFGTDAIMKTPLFQSYVTGCL